MSAANQERESNVFLAIALTYPRSLLVCLTIVNDDLSMVNYQQPPKRMGTADG